jgi:hypothetical protein
MERHLRFARNTSEEGGDRIPRSVVRKEDFLKRHDSDKVQVRASRNVECSASLDNTRHNKRGSGERRKVWGMTILKPDEE